MKRILLLALICPLLHTTLHAQEVREWTDKASGKKIEASMVSADPVKRTVTIQNKTGQSFTLPVDRLVDADLVYIKAHLNAPAAASAPAPTPAPAPGAPPAPVPAPAAAAKPAKASKPAAPVGQPAPPRPAIVVTPAKKFKHPQGSALLSVIKKGHPHFIYTAEGFAALKARCASDPVSQKLLASCKATGEKLLELPELVQVRGENASAASDPSAKMLFHMPLLAVLNYCDGDPRWKDYAAREMVSIASFTNWHPEEPEMCAQFVWAMALGFDWFHDAFNADQKKKVLSAIKELGIDALAAHLKGEPMPATTKRPEPGVKPTAAKGGPPKKAPRKEEDDGPVSTEEMLMAGALLHAAIALNEDESNVAGPAATLAAKFFGKGITGFAPDGIWHEGLFAGDKVLDMAASLIMTLRSAGNDFGLSTVEGIPQASIARLHLTGPNRRDIFNYGDSERGDLNRTWLTSFLAAIYGNPGVPALVAPGAANPDSAFMGIAGLLLYHSPAMGGYGTADSFDYAFSGAQVATLRSAWNDPKAYYFAMKGGDNAGEKAQLDLGTFVMEAGGVRWGIDLGTENDRNKDAHGAPSKKKFELYRFNTFGQNTWRFAGPGEEDDDKDKKKGPAAKNKNAPIEVPPGNQPQDATAHLIPTGFASTPDRGVATLDLTKAYSKYSKPLLRGAMMMRGPQPYLLLQDELKIKGSAEPEWVMHTRAEVAADGAKATLKSGGQTLTMSIISPKGATFATDTVPEPKDPNSQIGSFKGVTVLKVPLKGMKGDQTVVITFTLGDAPAAAPIVPLAQWVKKK